LSVFLFLKFGFKPALPGSVLALYAIVATLCLILYLTSSEAGKNAFLAPIIRLMVDAKLRPVLRVVLLLIPGAIAYQSYVGSLPTAEPPPLVRSVHPAPPSSISFTAVGDKEAKVFDLAQGSNPLRAFAQSDPTKFANYVKRGKAVYYQNCYFCHGDHLAADGLFATAVKPPPATFQDPGVLPLLQESFLFWRVMKGGPGLPDDATPWNSSMPVWEKMLSEEDMWAALLFLYDFTGFAPRAKVEVHH